MDGSDGPAVPADAALQAGGEFLQRAGIVHGLGRPISGSGDRSESDPAGRVICSQQQPVAQIEAGGCGELTGAAGKGMAIWPSRAGHGRGGSPYSPPFTAGELHPP